MATFDSSDRLDAGLRFDEPSVPVFPTPKKGHKLMSLFKLELSAKSPEQKAAMGAAHIAAMTGNANYPAATRVPTDAQMAAAQTKLTTAIAEADNAEVAWKQKLAARNEAEADYDTVITARAANCEAVTPGDIAKLTSTGFPMRSAATPAAPLGAPQNLRASMGDMPGEIDLMWDRLKGSSMNVVESREQGTTTWAQAGMVQQSKFTVGGLTSGKTYEFRVHGVGKDGDGPSSDLAVKMAP